MSSNLTVDTLTKGATTLNTDELVDVNNTRVCKAWVNFNGTGTVAIRASFNVSSITDNAVGDYTVNFTTAMSDANYAAGTAISSGSTTGNQATGSIYSATLSSAPTTKTTTQLRLRAHTTAATFAPIDVADYNVSIFR